MLQASGSWRTLERLARQGDEAAEPLAACLLRALCASPMQDPEQGRASLFALAQLEQRCACAMALSRCLMALAQELLLNGETTRAQTSLRQALASSVNAVAAAGMPMPTHLADQLISQAEQLQTTLASQLDLAIASRRQQLPAQLVLVLGMHRSGTSALSGLLIQAGLNAPLDLMPSSSANPRGFWESLAAVELSDQLLQQLGSHWSTCWELPWLGWDTTHAEAVSVWRTGMLQLLCSNFPAGGRAVLKDPRLCALLPALQPWLESTLISCTVFLPIRHPAEVAESLQIAQGLPRNQALLLWLGHVLHAERNSRLIHRLIVDYQQLLSDPQEILSRSAQILQQSCEATALPNTWMADEASSFIDPQLQRQRAETGIPNWVLDEQAEVWYELAIRVHAVMVDPKLKERKRRSSMDQLWRQWTTLAPQAFEVAERHKRM